MKIYVGNLPREISEAQLNELALPFGRPDSSNIARELAGGASKGFGFVDYAIADEARAAISGLDGKDVGGRILEVREANVPETCAPTSLLHTLG